MERMIGLIIIVAALWVGIEVYSEGTENAFGGFFAKLGLQSDEPQRADDREEVHTTVPRAVGNKVQGIYDERYDDM